MGATCRANGGFSVGFVLRRAPRRFEGTAFRGFACRCACVRVCVCVCVWCDVGIVLKSSRANALINVHSQGVATHQHVLNRTASSSAHDTEPVFFIAQISLSFSHVNHDPVRTNVRVQGHPLAWRGMLLRVHQRNDQQHRVSEQKREKIEDVNCVYSTCLCQNTVVKRGTHHVVTATSHLESAQIKTDHTCSTYNRRI